MRSTHTRLLILLVICGLLVSVQAGTNYGGQKNSNRVEDPPERNPQWLNKLIAELKAAPVANPPARIVRYWYRDQSVYYQPPRCCDIPGRLLDANGNLICLPDGGLTGRGDGKCADFFRERKNEKLIWQDKRKRK